MGKLAFPLESDLSRQINQLINSAYLLTKFWIKI